MPHYYSDPSLEPQKCPAYCHKPESGAGKGENCPICDGSGRLSKKDAEPDLETMQYQDSIYWYIRYHGSEPRLLLGLRSGPYPTEQAALAAARAAAKER